MVAVSRYYARFSGMMTQQPRTAIVLSAGYFGFFAHAGFISAVEECGIDYCAIAGSSAGAIVAATTALSGQRQQGLRVIQKQKIADHLNNLWEARSKIWYDQA